jgi:hypothetical protein
MSAILIAYPDFHAVGEESGFHPLADQSAMHGVDAAVNMDQASRIDPTTHLGQLVKRTSGRLLNAATSSANDPAEVRFEPSPCPETDHCSSRLARAPAAPQRQ